MSKPFLLIALFGVLVAGTAATAQNLCTLGTSDKLICLIPGAFGVNGIPLANPTHQGHFNQSLVSDLARPLDSAIALSTLRPISSPSSGITYSWDPAAKVFTASTDSLGPVLGERAETIGKYRLFVGVSYEYFKFDKLDGVDLKKDLPSVFTHQDDSEDVAGMTCSITPRDASNNTGFCGFVRDVIRTNSRFDLKIHQFTTFVTFGLTNRIDVSVAIPIRNVRMGLFSDATIVDNSFQTSPNSSPDHFFFPRPDCPAPCFNQSFSNVSSASGIGDITLRVKGTAWKGERAGLALGVDVRVPTGDELNLIGSGTTGFKPFVVWSYRSRVSPHIFVGYEANGSSVLAGDLLTGTKEKLPSQLTYAGGADVWLTKWLTAAFDLVGQQVFSALRVSETTFTELGACMDTAKCDPSQGFATPNTDPNLSHTTASYNITNASIGAKVRPFSNLLVTGNVLIKLNDGGLRANVVPLVAVSYTF